MSQDLIVCNTVSAAAADVATAAKRNGRATKASAEARCLVLLLDWDVVVTNGGKISARQHEEPIKMKTTSWVPKLRISYCLKVAVETRAIHADIEPDNSENKHLIHYINNFINPI